MADFYNQGDQDIYQSGQHYIPQEQYRLGYTAPPSIANAPTTGITGITSTQSAAPYIWPPRGGEGSGGSGGGGIFGNLDLSKGKTFTKNVWSQAGPPNEMDWVSKDVQGYYNPTLGMYQTLAGKNINHLGIKAKPMIARAFEAVGLGKKDKTAGSDFYPGQVEGTFTHGWKSGVDKIKQGWENEKEKFKNIGVLKKWRENKAIKKEKEIRDYNFKKWKEVQDAKGGDGGYSAGDNTINWDPNIQKTGPTYGPHQGNVTRTPTPTHHGTVAHGPGGRFEAANTQSSKSSGKDYGPWSKADGGRIGYAFGRGPVLDENVDENMLEFMQDQGVPHGEMAEGKSPFELRIDELMDTGMSWQEAYEIAQEEFGQIAEAPDESFSDQGIASIV